MPSNVLVSGLSDSQYNGLYVYDGIQNGRPRYIKGTFEIYWDGYGSGWLLIDTDNGADTASNSDVAYPWLAIDWFDEGIDPTGLVITEVPDQPTFGLPAETVALITSRFGTVANFLRLRNQGQI